MRERSYYVYIVASRTHVIYIGVTSRLRYRIHQHRTGTGGAFTSQYRCHRLVWFEGHSDPSAAIAREKELKGWLRIKKIALIEQSNPTWSDLSEAWYTN